MHPHRLQDYRDHVRHLLASHQLPDVQTRDLDESNLPLLVDSENRRDPGLRLTHCASPAAFARALRHLSATSDANGRQIQPGRFLVNIDGAHGGHFVAFDARAAGQKISVIAIDSDASDRPESVLPAIWDAGLNVELRSIGLGTQKSGVGCAIFGLSHALKLRQHADHFEPVHAATLMAIHDDPNDPDISSASNEAFKRAKSLWHEAQRLPASFYKHVQSRRDLDRLLASNPHLLNEDTRKHPGREPRTLAQRLEMHVGTYRPGNAALALSTTSRTYGESIGKKRLALIERALAQGTT